ncbi:DNA-3-methyladenine glycosylase [Candidatus Cyanaurora vandensis]|uniref:DNA-3-methyladenine glycosylase n=1 Tax=Candidatus Cyanaurora vandensis TaxID=2714958 RepID=UPI00257F8752|nr:DNA-3-methyladenine glycosylase [Candidatus Cyanaurora vandensis]
MDFFDRSALLVAPELLGWSLNRRVAGATQTARLVEVEAYTQGDPACHAYRRRTPRNEVMFGPSGYAYVYLIYGMYFCLNIVCEPEGIPGAVLIRAAAGGLKGPGVLCRDWGISRAQHNGTNLLDPTSDLWLTPGLVDPALVIATKRVGITQGVELPWRFCLKDHPDVSVKPGQERLPVRRRKATL